MKAEMGQSIVTSHSAPVIEQFEPDSIVMLHREGARLMGSPIDASKVKRKTFMTERRQFAEAILARGVLVVEGSTEAVVYPAISSALETFRSDYTHLDFAGVSVFTASGDGDVDRYGPIFTGQFAGAFFTEREEAPHVATRRLLRVAITRARHTVVIVRPKFAPSLVSPSE